MLLAGAALFVGRILYEETFLTWIYGPRMVGFAMMHGAVPYVLLAGLIGLPGGLLWVFGSLILLFWKKLRIPLIDWVPLTLLPILMSLLFIPYGAWEELVVELAGPGSHGNEFMIEGVVYGKRRLVIYLLQRGYDVNYEDAGGRTPLSTAAVGGDKEMVNFLISKGADVNRKENLTGGTPLINASEMGKLESVKVLLGNGADPCATNKEGHTAAGLAKKYGHGEIAEYLNSRFHCQEKVIDPCAPPSVSACVHP